MEVPASAVPSNNISAQEWAWVQALIQDVQRQEMCDAFVKNLWQWDLVVKQFKKVEHEYIILGSPTDTDWKSHEICLHALLAIGKFLALEAKKLTDSELATFSVTREQIEAYVAELEQNFREWHHGIPEHDLNRVREKIFGVTS